jgi:hypothetical protein
MSEVNKDAIEAALRWLDLRYQEKGNFRASALVQGRSGEWVGLARLLAEYRCAPSNAPE